MEIKYIVDEMCGKIARWLRLLGFDTVYLTSENSDAEAEVDDDYLLSRAIIEKRILVTRDVTLYKRAVKVGVRVILIQCNDIKNKLREVLLNTLKDKTLMIKPRCPICNGTLKRIDKEEVKKLVPKRVFESFNKFLFCEKCKKVYWFGTHWKYIKRTLEEIGFNVIVKNGEKR